MNVKSQSHSFHVESLPAAAADLGGSGFNVITEANTFPSVRCGLCVVHIIGLQDVKCHPRTEPGEEWAECLFRGSLSQLLKKVESTFSTDSIIIRYLEGSSNS